jgi:hypothetical protein
MSQRGRSEQQVATGGTQPPCGLSGAVDGGIAGKVEQASPTATRARGPRSERYGVSRGRARGLAFGLGGSGHCPLRVTRGAQRCIAIVTSSSSLVSSLSRSSARSRVPHRVHTVICRPTVAVLIGLWSMVMAHTSRGHDEMPLSENRDLVTHVESTLVFYY